MGTGAIAAIVTAAAALITAVGGLVAQLRHRNGPAHRPASLPKRTPGASLHRR